MASTRRELLKAMALAWVGGLAPQLGQRFYDGCSFVPGTHRIQLPGCCNRIRPGDALTLAGFEAAIERLKGQPTTVLYRDVVLVKTVTMGPTETWALVEETD